METRFDQRVERGDDLVHFVIERHPAFSEPEVLNAPDLVILRVGNDCTHSRLLKPVHRVNDDGFESVGVAPDEPSRRFLKVGERVRLPPFDVQMRRPVFEVEEDRVGEFTGKR